MSELITMDMIVVEQIPVIKERLKEVAAEIDKRLSVVDGLLVTEKTVKEVKKIRADFNKEYDAAETMRKAVKAQVLDPYNDFEVVYKKCVGGKYAAAKKKLDAKVNEVENELRKQKTDRIFVFFNEYAESCNVNDYADFERQVLPTRMSDSDTMLKKVCKARIDTIVADLNAIDAQPEELRAEILAEYKKSLVATTAISIVAERHKSIAAQLAIQTARAEQQAVAAKVEKSVDAVAPLTPPVPSRAPPTAAPKEEVDPIRTVTFTATARLSLLKELKAFLIEKEIKYT